MPIYTFPSGFVAKLRTKELFSEASGYITGPFTAAAGAALSATVDIAEFMACASGFVCCGDISGGTGITSCGGGHL